MSPIEGAALFAAMSAPLHWLVYRQLAKERDRDLRRCRIVIVRERALEAHSRSIGEFRGHAIWETVMFRGALYRFDRIQPASRKDEIAPGELFLEPGLVYVIVRA